MDCYFKIWIVFNHFQSCKREHHHKKKIRLSLLGHRRFLFNLDDIRYTHMGCWKISSTSPIASLEQKDYRLTVSSRSRQNAIPTHRRDVGAYGAFLDPKTPAYLRDSISHDAGLDTVLKGDDER